MKILNNTEVFEPSECLFAVGIVDPAFPQDVMIAITDKRYWEEEGYLNDSIGDHSFADGVIPEGMFNSMEGTWETKLPLEKARQAMLRAGFVECKEFTDFVFREL